MTKFEEAASRSFDCALCGETFVSGWSAAEARAEYERNFAADVRKDEPVSQLCDGCYGRFMAWWSGLSADQRERLERERLAERER